MWMPIQLDLNEEHTGLLSPLCYECPHGMTGCCASPPGFDWSDIGRVLTLGARDWLLAELEAGRILTLPHRHGAPARGLQLRRVENTALNSGTWPTKCGYHGEQGCTIGRDRRPATCNYYICDDAYDRAGPDADAAREAHATLQTLYGRWDLEIAEAVAKRWPGAIPWETEPGAVLDLVERHYRKLLKRDRRELRSLRATDPR